MQYHAATTWSCTLFQIAVMDASRCTKRSLTISPSSLGLVCIDVNGRKSRWLHHDKGLLYRITYTMQVMPSCDHGQRPRLHFADNNLLVWSAQLRPGLLYWPKKVWNCEIKTCHAIHGLNQEWSCLAKTGYRPTPQNLHCCDWCPTHVLLTE